MKTLWISLVLTALSSCEAQRSFLPPFSPSSLRQIFRTYVSVPQGRSSSLKDIMILRYSTVNSTEFTAYRLGTVGKMRSDPGFDPSKPTVLYAHGYVEYTTDDSVRTIVKAYRQNGEYNILVLDWSNIAFGNYVIVSLGVESAGAEVGRAMLNLIKGGGVSREGLHFVGHSMGVHILAAAARYMAAAGVTVPRLTGLDAAYPGFYPSILFKAATVSDAEFVDMIHTDGGGYGAPHSIGHADFWPNGGTAKQPGCVSATLFLTSEEPSSSPSSVGPRFWSETLRSTAAHFCSHWRSWAFWAEAVAGSNFWSRQCDDYDTFLRGLCAENAPVLMGPKSGTDIRGNFYLRTAATEPYSLGKRGAE